MMRPQSEIGFLMLQWLGVLVPGAFREEVKTWGGSRTAGKTVAMQTEIERRSEEAFWLRARTGAKP